VDGEIKTWALARCLREEFSGDSDPVRRNVEFFIQLRNKTEHRYEQLLATAVAGKTQALVLNYEEAVVGRFGSGEGLADSLRLPVFVSSLTPGAVQALKKTHRRLPKKVTTFIREYDASMPEEVQGDWRYDFRVILLPQTGPKTEADAVMRFVREADMTDEQREARDVVQTIVRTRQVPVRNLRVHKPGVVAAKVQAELGVKMSLWDHTMAWRHFEVRPQKGAKRPELTNERYCIWDEPHQDYLYTDAWVKKLVKDLRDRKEFQKIVGHWPRPLSKNTRRAAA
jgi:hypothetical protein